MRAGAGLLEVQTLADTPARTAATRLSQPLSGRVELHGGTLPSGSTDARRSFPSFEPQVLISPRLAGPSTAAQRTVVRPVVRPVVGARLRSRSKMRLGCWMARLPEGLTTGLPEAWNREPLRGLVVGAFAAVMGREALFQIGRAHV
mgnify:CR=1 FL=1